MLIKRSSFNRQTITFEVPHPGGRDVLRNRCPSYKPYLNTGRCGRPIVSGTCGEKK